MTDRELMQQAREAGWSGLYTTYNEPTGKADWKMVKESLTVPVTMEQIERFATLVAAAEREACAKVCDELAANDKLSNYYAVAARAIRDRGEK